MGYAQQIDSYLVVCSDPDCRWEGEIVDNIVAEKDSLREQGYLYCPKCTQIMSFRRRA